MQLPAFPSENEDDIYAYLKSMHFLMRDLHVFGTQVNMATLDELNEMATENSLSQVGKIFYCTTNDTYYRTKKSGSNLLLEVF